MTSDSIPTNLALPQRYKVLDEIARGRMGAIYRMRDDALCREVAGKVPEGKYAAEQGADRRFVGEILITAGLKHPAIPPVYDFGVLPDGRYFMPMELIEGRTLEDCFKERADLAAQREWFVRVFDVVCHAVAYAHARGVVHRDLEPANVMIGKFGEIRVLDWGLAIVIPEKQLGSASVEDARLGAVYGNPAYMAPEQARGDPTDFRADVFGLGALLCHGLTGAPPFAGGSVTEVARKTATGDIGDALARLDGCGAEAELVALAKECLRQYPEGRPANAMQVASLLVTAREVDWRRSSAAGRSRWWRWAW
jgi:serine/threonine-protein kinase